MARTSRYSPSTAVVPSVAVFCSTHTTSSCAGQGFLPGRRRAWKMPFWSVQSRCGRKPPCLSVGPGRPSVSFGGVQVNLAQPWPSRCLTTDSFPTDSAPERRAEVAPSSLLFQRSESRSLAESSSPWRSGRRVCRREAAPPPARSGRGANMAPNMVTTASKELSAQGRSSASPSANSMSNCAAAARSLACSSRLGAISTPVTLAPAFAAGIGGVACATGYIKNGNAGFQVEAGDVPLAFGRSGFPIRAKITRHPGGLQAGFELRKTGEAVCVVMTSFIDA